MGKKAVNLLVHTVLIIFTLTNVLLTGLAMIGATKSPVDNGFFALLALGLPGLLFTNLIFVFYWIIRRRWWLVFPLIMLGANYRYYPRIFQFSSKDISSISVDAKTIRIATYNVNYFSFQGYDLTCQYVSQFMKDNNVDVVCFQEFGLNPEVPPQKVADYLGLKYYALGFNSLDFNDIAIFSRYPITNTKAIVFAESANSAMCTDIDVDGQTIKLIGAHLQTTSINWEKDDLQRQLALGTTEDQARAAIRISNIMKTNFRRRAYQADQLAALMDTTKMPVIFCGDTNDTPSSYTYNTLTGNTFSKDGKRRDGFLEAGRGYAYTYNTMKKLLRIDYIFHSDNMRCLKYYSPRCEWSDHNPVISEIEL